MQQIQLHNADLHTNVDDYFYDYLKQFKWSLSPDGYAWRWCKRTYKLMHREVAILAKWNLVKGVDRIDHINRNKLDNQITNLRICNQSQNAANSIGTKRNTSGYKGVFYRKAS